MQNIIGVLNRPVSARKARRFLLLQLALLTVFFGYMFYTRRPPAATVSIVIPGGPVVPVFDRLIHGGFGEMQFDKPMAVTAAHDRIYVADTNNARIQVFDNTGAFLFAFGERGPETGRFLYPYGLVGTPDGELLVADLYKGRIQVYDADGNYLRDFAAALTQNDVLRGPGDLHIAGGVLYVTDINRNIVLLIDLATEQLLRTVALPHDLLAPNGVAVDEAGYIYVVDTGRQRVVVFRPDGNPVRVINGTPTGHGLGSVLLNPRGIGLDRAGNIFVVSNLTHTVFVFDRQGRAVTSFGGSGTENDKFMFPNGLYVDPAGRLLVTDTGNQRVAVWRLTR